MLRKLLVVITITAISVFCLCGCKKRPSQTQSGEEAIKTTAEYETEANREIDKENMAAELENIEKELEEELKQEQ